MPALHLPWLELAVAIPLLGSLWALVAPGGARGKFRGLIASCLALACALGAWVDFLSEGVGEAHDRWDLLAWFAHRDLLVIDELSAPLISLTALIFLLTILATPRTKYRVFSFSRCLLAEAIALATLACKQPWGVIALLAAGTLPPLLELHRMRKPMRVYGAHMALFIVLLVLGQALLPSGRETTSAALPAVLMLTAATLLRSGIVPVHCWMTDLFEHTTIGTALSTVTPMIGAYGVTRLVLPIAPHWVLWAISLVSLFTAVYAAGMALVQKEGRRFFCYLFLSHSSLVLAGLETATPIALTGALSLWMSVGLALTGFGLALRFVESRMGRISLAEFSGLYQQIPMLAALFLLTGLASIGFPGTVGFAALELLVEGAVQAQPFEGACVVIVAALNGLAVMHAYFRIFAGKPHHTTIDLHARPNERLAALLLIALIVGGGLFPGPGILNRYAAAVDLARVRQERGMDDTARSVLPAKPHPARSSVLTGIRR